MRADDDHGPARAKAPPHSAEAEQSLLGCLLTDAQGTFDAVGDMLRPDDFHFSDHRAIFRTIAGLVLACKAVDVLTVFEAGGHELAYLHQLMEAVPVLRHAPRYAEIIREHSARREVMRLARGLMDDAASGDADKPLHDVIDAACAQLLQLQAGVQQVKEPVLVADLLGQWLTDLDARYRGETDAISTGLPDVDNALDGGLRGGEVMVLAARPSMGKSAMALQIARHMSASVVVGVLTMEDSNNMLVSRQVAAQGGLNLAHVRRPDRAPDTLWAAVASATEALAKLSLYVDDSPALRLRDVRTKALQIKRKAGGRLGVLMVDYLQLMEGDGETRAQELTEVARGMKRLAKELGIPVVLLSQLSRKADETNAPPRLDHLAESGGIEQAADIIGLLWRECRRNPRPGNEHSAQLEFVKNKNAATCTVHLHFAGTVQRFSSAAHGGHDD